MCGRFTLRAPANAWCQMFLPNLEIAQAAIIQEQFGQPRYNIAPTDQVACLRHSLGSDGREFFPARWGLIPPWADDMAIGSRMINARCETIDAKRSFKPAFSERRCIVLADGYYEWLRTGDGKQPYLIESDRGGVLAMAGLWERNRRASGHEVVTCTIITTEANRTTCQIHDRMPVFLDAEDTGRWLSPETSLVDAKTMLKPADDDLLTTTAVSTYVNRVQNKGPECTEPFEAPPQQQSLF